MEGMGIEWTMNESKEEKKGQRNEKERERSKDRERSVGYVSVG